jgi:hypothetical protein
MKGFIERHIYGILGTIVIHLIIAIIFMTIKLSVTYQLKSEAILINFESVGEEKKPDELEIPERLFEMLDNDEYWANIAANIASTADEDFDIDEYINQIKEELIASGEITEDNFLDQQKNMIEEIFLPGETAFTGQTEPEEEYTGTSAEMAASYSGLTRIYYNMPGRNHKRLPLPIYKCEGDGKVVLDLIVDQKGFVLSANVIKEESSADDYCLYDAAKKAALQSKFNASLSAPMRQKGTITYHFVAQ